MPPRPASAPIRRPATDTGFAPGLARIHEDGDGAPQQRSPRSIPEQIAEEVGAAILAGRHALGERLIETDLAQAFGVSRAPIRECLRILERRRLVEIVPRRGAYVREVSLNSIADLFNTRLALSTMAARQMALARPPACIDILRERVAAIRELAESASTGAEAFALAVTRAVRAIARGSRNELLIELLSDLARQTVWTTLWRSPLDYLTPESRLISAGRFDAILEAIERGLADEAEASLRDLLEDDRDQAIRHLAAMRGETCDPHRVMRAVRR